MKKIICLLSVSAGFLISCNNNGKDSVDKADSINRAGQDTAMNANNALPDEAGSAFLVRVANSGMAETTIASYAQQHAVNKPVQEYAGMLNREHTALNEQVKNLAAQKNITLPDSMTSDKQDDINSLEKKTGKDFDKSFLSMMIKNHEASIALFEKAMTDVKDADIRSLIDKTLPVLHMHLDSAKVLQTKY